MKQKQKKFVNNIIKQLQKFVSDCGGWLSFIGRMIWNAIMLWVAFTFIKGFFLYSFISQDLPIPPERLEAVGTVIWAICILYMLTRIPTFSEVKEK